MKSHGLYDASDAETQNWCIAAHKLRMMSILTVLCSYFEHVYIHKQTTYPEPNVLLSRTVRFLYVRCGYGPNLRYAAFSVRSVHLTSRKQLLNRYRTAPYDSYKDKVRTTPHGREKKTHRAAPSDFENVKTAPHRTMRFPKNEAHQTALRDFENRKTAPWCGSTP